MEALRSNADTASDGIKMRIDAAKKARTLKLSSVTRFIR